MILALLLISAGARADALCDGIAAVLADLPNGLTSPDVRGRFALRDEDTNIYDSPLKLFGDRCTIQERGRPVFYCSWRDAPADAQPRLANAVAACPLRFRGAREDETSDRRGARSTRFEVIAGPKLVTIDVSEWVSSKSRRRVSLSMKTD